MTTPLRRTLPLLLAIASALGAADTPPADATAKADPPKLDPTTAIVSEGRQVYRQRDVDALVLIAERHRKAKLSAGEEDQLRQALARILVAREPLLEALQSLPSSLGSGKAHDALLLDILDYQAEPKAAPAGTTPKTADASKPAEPAKAGEPAKAPDAKAENGPVIVSLPPLTQTRTIDKVGKRQLAIQIALLFPDAATAKKFEERAPVIRDAILGYVHQLPPADFAEPDQIALKQGLQTAIAAKLPDFPKDSILIPQLDAGAPDADAKKDDR
jgi:flagellar basal body-associated protein FliL